MRGIRGRERERPRRAALPAEGSGNGEFTGNRGKAGSRGDRGDGEGGDGVSAG